MTDTAETVYVCNCKTGLAHFFRESEGHVIDHLKQHFPGIEDRLFGYDFERPWDSREQEENAVLFVDRRLMDIFVYDFYDEIDFGYHGLRQYDRGRQKDLVDAFVCREIGIVKDVGGQKTGRILKPVGPLVIVVGTGELSRKKQPTEYHPELHRLTDNAWKESIDSEPAEEEPWRRSLDDRD